MPVCFVTSEDLVYSVIDEKPKRTRHLRRVRNIEESGRATLIVDHYEDDWTRLGWVMLRTAATLLEPGDEHRAAIALLRDRYPQYREMALEEAPLLRLEVVRATEWWASTAD